MENGKWTMKSMVHSAKARCIRSLACLILLLLCAACEPSSPESSSPESSSPEPAHPAGLAAPEAEREALAAEMEDALRQHLLDPWYPRAVDDEYGGFLSRFDYRWEAEGPQDKFIVTQARHTWTTAQAARFYPADTAYLPMARHGFAFLRDALWDDEYGGFFELVTRDGTLKTDPPGTDGKRAYGNAFGIYGLAAYYAASGDEAALQLAQEAFRWLDAHAHDPEQGGYFQFMARDGTPFTEGFGATPPKDQNSSIHLLEAFTELYHVWPDSVLGARLGEMLHLIRDTITTDRGYLTLFSQADWTPVSYRDSSAAVREAHHQLDHVSFGHDVETAFLLLEASEALGLEDDTTTQRIAKKMVDHALRNGWDAEAGGFYDAGYYTDDASPITILQDTKNWWAQAEGMNALLLMAEHYPDDEMAYYDRFLQQWDYIKANLIDWEHGGWYPGGLDKQPQLKQALKGQIWKGAYHDARSLMGCIRRLRR
jgi:mannobiose 2-epimerase